MKTDRRREIKRDPTSAEPGEAQHLTAEYRRLSRPAPADRPERERTLSDSLLPDGLSEADRAAVETWPPELRARLLDHALTRQILPWRG